MTDKNWKAEAEKIVDHITNDRLKEAVELILSLSPQDVHDKGVLISGRLKHIESQLMTGTIGNGDERREHAKISEALLAIAEEIKSRKDYSQAPVIPPEGTIPEKVESSTLEKIISSSSNMKEVVWLKDCLNACLSVCRVVTANGIGTGFMVTPNLLMTCNHVLPIQEVAKGAYIEFNYQVVEKDRLGEVVKYRLEPSNYFLTRPSLDFTIVQVNDSSNDVPLSSWGHLTIDVKSPIYVADPTSIIQHPEGGPKKITLSAKIAGIWEHRVHYLTDTLPGSSGSPVLNDNWQVVAIHHKGGNIQVSPRGDTRYLNEGVRMSYILNEVEKSGLPVCFS